MPTAKEELQKALRDNNPGAINEALDRIRAEKQAAGNAVGGQTGVSGGANRPPLATCPKKTLPPQLPLNPQSPRLQHPVQRVVNRRRHSRLPPHPYRRAG